MSKDEHTISGIAGSLSGRSVESDLVLMARVAEGDREVFDRFTAKYHARMLKLALSRTKDMESAKECVVEGLLRAYRSARLYKGQSGLTTWVSRIVINCALDSRRRERRHPTLSFHDTCFEREDWSAQIVDPEWEQPFLPSSVDPEQKDLLRDLLLKMEVWQREIILMSHRDELPYPEIARRLGVPVGTVKSRLSRARSELRQLVLSTMAEAATAREGGYSRPDSVGLDSAVYRAATGQRAGGADSRQKADTGGKVTLGRGANPLKGRVNDAAVRSNRGH